MLPVLAPLFPGSSQVAVLGLAEAEDIAIWSFAEREGYAIVTKDADFVELSLMRGFPPKVILINLGNVPNAVIQARLCAESQALRDFVANASEGILEIE